MRHHIICNVHTNTTIDRYSRVHTIIIIIIIFITYKVVHENPKPPPSGSARVELKKKTRLDFVLAPRRRICVGVAVVPTESRVDRSSLDFGQLRSIASNK
jgi:hypothetical protein